jgi:hypothetical protein
MRTLALVWVAGLCCAACSGEDAVAFTPASDSGVAATGGTGAGSSGSGGSGGSSNDAAGGTCGSGADGGGTGGSGGELAGEGYLFVYQAAADYRLVGSFESWKPTALCSYSEVGPCRIDRCAEAMVMVSAGTVFVSAGAKRQTASYDSSTGIYGGDWLGELWQPGQAVRFVASGAEVPALDETVIGPAPLTLLEPAPGSTVSVSRTAPLRVRWSGATYGTAVFGISDYTSGQFTRIKCSYDPALGEAMLPAEVLTPFDASDAVTLQALSEGYKSWTSGGWSIRVGARAEFVSATLDFQ